jgi:hypothetical protein
MRANTRRAVDAQRGLRGTALCVLLVACGHRPQRVSQDAGAGTDAAYATSEDAGDAGTPIVRIPTNHRPEAGTCDQERPSNVPDGGLAALGGSCAFDSDCTDGGADGRCIVPSLTTPPRCSYDECFADTDCADGGVCACRDEASGNANVCVPGNCHVDADCGDGGYCSPSPGGCWPYAGTVGYYCHTPQDTCANDSDCRFSQLFCIFDTTVAQRWVCAPLDCSG